VEGKKAVHKRTKSSGETSTIDKGPTSGPIGNCATAFLKQQQAQQQMWQIASKVATSGQNIGVFNFSQIQDYRNGY
jgi:hypothetical protein